MSVEVGPLREITVIATASFVVLSAGFVQQPVLINAVFSAVVFCALVVYSAFAGISPLSLPVHLASIVFEDTATSSRHYLLLLWTVNTCVSILFTIYVSRSGQSSTKHRKLFHLTVSLIYLSGLFTDPQFTNLCGWLSICIFVIIEVFRYYNVPPWGDFLNNYLMVFKDEQDQSVLLTPIFLLLGVFFPLMLSPLGASSLPSLYHTAGVVSVGIGDSMAALVGSTMGRCHWPGSRKTVEGSVAMALSIFGSLLFFRPFCATPPISLLHCFFASILLTVAEAWVRSIDNVLLPVIGYFIL